jgi:hypothetical protein
VDSNVSATRLDKSLEGGLLFRIQHVASGIQEYDSLIHLKVFIVEQVGISGSVYRESVLLAKLQNGRLPEGN